MRATHAGSNTYLGESANPTIRKRRRNVRAHVYGFIQAWFVAILISIICGCGVVNLGKFKGIESTASDEEYYLLKDVKLTGGLSRSQREVFDHTMLSSVNVVFVPKNEKNHYVSKTTWYDPSGTEFRTIRQTHDVQQETAIGDDRDAGGTTRIHSLKSKELFDHEPGRWKVELFLDDKLARRLEFTVR